MTNATHFRCVAFEDVFIVFYFWPLREILSIRIPTVLFVAVVENVNLELAGTDVAAERSTSIV
jgi:hypothetical protein